MIIKRLLFFFSTLVFTTSIHSLASVPIVMIDPAGHAKDLGRKLHQGYERAETYKCAKALQEYLQKNYGMNALLTRTPGQTLSPFQPAIMANRLDVDLFIRFHFYKNSTEKPKIGCFHLVFDPVLDFAKRSFNPHEFIPLYRAHYQNINKTIDIGQILENHLRRSEYVKLFDFRTFCGLPLGSLVGIKPPALIVEMGLNKDDQWNMLIEPFAKGINAALNG